MAERDAPRSSARDIAGEDFLFHLYRGSELLQDNRVHDAKAELEQALSLQPSDPKGQDLLGIVYFRLGLYPRAIAIYERLIHLHPEAIEPRINLALSYLKTGQPAQARFELEKVVELSPGHSRAWGYLGLAFQRLGDYERASYAFSAGGHDGMARRLVEMSVAGGAVSIRPEARPDMTPPKAEPLRAGDERLEEIDKADAAFRAPEDDDPARGEPGRGAAWNAIAPPPPLVPSLGPLSARYVDPPPSAPRRQITAGPRRATDIAREALLVFPRDLPVARHASGVVLVQATAGFATRLDAIRSMSGAAGSASAVLQRRTRGRLLDEPLGGPSAPIVEVTGKGELVLGPSIGKELHPIALDDDALYLREDALIGFEPGVGYENGRLPVGDGESISMVQLRGPGTVIASLPEHHSAVEVTDGRSIAVRAVAVVGWIGRVVPRALLASEAPAGVRGMVAFAGEGMVLVDGR